MAVINAFANKAAAVSAGYTFTSWASPDGTWSTTAERALGGPSGDPDAFQFRAYATGQADQTTAETLTLASLNGQRKMRYGGGASQVDGAAQSAMDMEGHALILDVT